jgi:hypothetical protein
MYALDFLTDAGAMSRLIVLTAACAAAVATCAAAAPPAPARLLRARAAVNVSYNHRGFMLDSEPMLWIAGSMHYPRFTPGLWPNAMRLAKEMGMNAVTSYVVRTNPEPVTRADRITDCALLVDAPREQFWNLHEPEPGKYDFSGRRNITAFLQEAHDADLLVHLRFGPCASYLAGALLPPLGWL